MADKLYGTVMKLKATSMYKDMSSFSSFIYDDMDENVPANLDFTLEHELQVKNADALYNQQNQ